MLSPDSPHPILKLLGFHFYRIKSRVGCGGYLLITKRKTIRSIKCIHRFSEYCLIDADL